MSTSILTRSVARSTPRYFSSTAYNASASTSSAASHAYHIPHNPAAGPSRPPPPPPRTRATTEKPVLTADEQQVIDRIVRVDQAGELGANWIYRGQKMAMGLRGDRKAVKQIDEMWESEKHHLNVMSTLQTQHQTRPTLLYPLWKVAAFGLGAGTGLMGREAAMACTEAVETVIGEHYDDQLRELTPILAKMSAEQAGEVHPSLPLLKQILEEFRDDELEHLDTAVEEGAQRAPGHALLGAVIGWGCKAAIGVCKRI